MRLLHFIIFIGVTAGLWIGGCESKDEAAPKTSAKVSVVVSIEPQAYFVERIGGEYVDFEVLVPSGSSPHTYEPTPQQMTKLGEAQLYFSIGVPFEQTLLKKITSTFENLEIVNTHGGIQRRPLAEPHEHEDEHPHEHEAGEPDPHIWLDPLLVKQQAQSMAEALIGADPEHRTDYESNLSSFEADLDAVHREIEEVLAPLKGREFFVYHAAFGYFGQRYGLKQVPVEVGGKNPSAKQLSQLIEKAKTAHVKVIFVQQQFSSQSAEAIAKEIGGVVVPMDPLARNYLNNLRKMAGAIRKGLTDK